MTQPSQIKSALHHSLLAVCQSFMDASATATATTEPAEHDSAETFAHMLEQPRSAQHGDFSCTAAFILSKFLRQPPLKIAQQIIDQWQPPSFVEHVSLAGAGFINLHLRATAKVAVVKEILECGERYGRQSVQAPPILLEFISANPTGPLHIGHGRACAYGDSLANILTEIGYTVYREYYVNDSGRQMAVLTASAWLRYWLTTETLPTCAYQGGYVREVLLAPLQEDLAATTAPTAADLTILTELESEAATKYLQAMAEKSFPESFAACVAKVSTLMLDGVIKKDIEAMGVSLESLNFFSEGSLHRSHAIERVLEILRQRGHIEERDGALWFQSTRWQDDKDRVVRRSDGEWTYFAADIAYHENKLNRLPTQAHQDNQANQANADSPQLLNILGADHHGYVPRLQAVLQALGFPATRLQTELIQFVSLIKKGVRQKMSTRSGEFIPLQQLIKAVGRSASRYFFISRKNDQHLDFDIDVAVAENKDNPLYYIRYAKARIMSVRKRWESADGAEVDLQTASLAVLTTDTAALTLCQKLSDYPELLQRIGEEHCVHSLAHYALELASTFHVFYERTRILGTDESADIVNSRVALLQASRQVLDNIGRLLGLRLPESM